MGQIVIGILGELRHLLRDRWTSRAVALLAVCAGLFLISLIFGLTTTPTNEMSGGAILRIIEQNLIAQVAAVLLILAITAALVAVVGAYTRLPVKSDTSMSSGSPKDANAKPEPPKTASGSDPVLSAAVELGFLSIQCADLAGIEANIELYGSDWPPISIEWPEGSARLDDLMKQALRALAHSHVRAEGQEHFVSRANEIRSALLKRKQRAGASCGTFIRRIGRLGSVRTAAIERYLVLAHYEIFYEAADILSWSGLRHFGIQLPKDWAAILRQPPERWKADATAFGKPLYMAWVSDVDGREIPEAVVEIVENVARPFQHISPHDFAKWAAPSLELSWSIREHLPEVYSDKPTLLITKSKKIGR